MEIKIYPVSGNTIEELILKIHNKDFTFDIENKFKASLMDDGNLDYFELENLINENKEKSFLKEKNIILYCGKSQEKLAFLFPGQGSQYLNMGEKIKKLAKDSLIENADEVFSKINKGKKISEFIFSDKGNQGEEELKNTDYAQPAIGLCSALFIDVLKSLSINPDFLAGHSFGEISGLYASGAVDFQTFMEIASTRGKLMAECGRDKDSGSMMAVLGSMEQIQEVIDTESLDLIIANKNSPKQNVVSGPTDEIEKAVKIFRKERLRGIKLPVAAAFHSSLVKDAALPFSKFLENTKISEPKIPVTSNTTGDFHGKTPGEIKDLLSKQLTSPVLFTDNMETLAKQEVKVFIEVGPKKVLSDLGKQILGTDNCFFASIDESCGKNPIHDFASVLALLNVLGFSPDMEKWNKI